MTTVMGFTVLVGSFLLLGLLLRFSRVPKRILAMADIAPGEDEDMKIAGSSFGSDPAKSEELADQAAKEFLRQKEKGNIDKAGALGDAYANKLWQVAQELIMNQPEQEEERVRNTLVLYSYVINKVITDNSPTSLLAQTALSVFYTRVEELSSLLDGYISDTAAITLYMVSSSRGKTEDIGKIFASVCGDADNAEYIAQGNQAYRDFYKISEEIYNQVATYKK